MENTKEMGMLALKTIARPSVAIVKTIPEGIIELSLRGAAIVSSFTDLSKLGLHGPAWH